MADDELWHVRIAADDVKTLTLEQLDDLFRLDVIDADVLVWQPGMDEWLPLRVVAGIGDDQPEVVNIQVSEPPPRPIGATTATAWPPTSLPPPRPLPAPSAPPRASTAPMPVQSWPPQVAAAASPASSWPPQVAAAPSRPAPAPSRAPAPVSRLQTPPPPSSRAPASASSAANSWPPPSPWSNPPPSPYAATVSAAPQLPFQSQPVQRAAFDTELSMRRKRSGGGWIVVVALAAGAAVTLYRNAVVHAAAKSMGQETAYLKLETSLGGPSFGTPRAVERMAEAAEALRAAAPPAVAEPVAPPKPKSEEPAPVETASPAVAAKAPEVAKPEPPKAAAPQPARASGPSRPASVTRTVSAEPDPVFKTPKKGKKPRGNEYDPLNPTL